MEHRELIEAIRGRAGAQDDDEAGRALDATLRELGRHVSGSAAEGIARHLPPEDASALTGGDAAPRPGGAEQIFDAVAQRLGTDRDHAADLVQGVLRAIAEHVPQEALDAAAPQLPTPLSGMFQGRTQEGPMRVETEPDPRLA